MQDDGFGSYDEVEPRRMPKQASKFDSRPFPMVPEVSLIMDKPPQPKKMDDTSSNSIPELRLTSTRNSSIQYKTGESYAAWKEKQFPQQTVKNSPPINTPNRYDQIYSSTQNVSNFQDNHGFRESVRSCNSLDYKDYTYKNYNSEPESPRKYSVPRRNGKIDTPNKYTLSHVRSNDHIDNPNKYTLSHARSNDHIDHHYISNTYSYTPRSHERDESPSPVTRRRSDHSRVPDVHDTRQKQRIYRSSSCSNADSYAHRSIPIEHDYPSKHSRLLQPLHYSPEHSHHYSGCCTSNHNNSGSETETVKNLLQVITSQNEQIKNLQKQVERLLKLHEQTLRERKHCTCQTNGVVYQNAQLYDHSRNANLPIAHNNMMKEKERYLSDLKMQDEKNQQTILEQKVSIGVMTSFELKVQNNPSSALENETKEKNYQEKVLPTSNIIKNLVNDTGEMIRKKPNFFTPTPLENISEGSESYMSSLRQSHLCSDTTRQSIEAQDCVEVQNTNFYKQNDEENENKQRNLEPRKKQFSNEKVRHNLDTLDYEIKESMYERTNKDRNVQEKAPCQYNHQYENLPSSPHEDFKKKKSDDYNAEPLLHDITKMKSIRCDNFADECLSLSSSEVDVDDPSPPSPEPSIHLDMQEYSSEGGSLPPQRKVGWTLYDNVLDQVNQILQNTPLNDDEDEEPLDGMRRNDKKEYENNVIMDTVKAATLEQLTKLGISFSDNVEQREPNFNKKVLFDASYYTRQGPETHLAATSGSIETNTSMHMKALAMKYLNDDQLADITLQKPRPGVLKQAPNNVQNSNMSFATMHYLQRYHLLPGNNTSPMRDSPRKDYRAQVPMIDERIAIQTVERREPSPHRYPPFTGTSKVSCPSKILDISTLKQQPKLL